MTIGVWVLGDRLWKNQAALQTCSDRIKTTPVILIESLDFIHQRPYHRQKLALVWSAMRHFAAELREAGWQVSYSQAADNFVTPLTAWIKENKITELRVTSPCDRYSLLLYRRR